jgi:hypothetical protein
MRFIGLVALFLISMAQISFARGGRGHGGGNAPEPASIAMLLMGAGAAGNRLYKNYKNKKKPSDKA